MSSNLKIVCDVATCDVKLDVIHGEGRKVNGRAIIMKKDGSAPQIRYKDPTGNTPVQYQEVDATTGAILQGRTSVYADASGNVFQKSEVKPYYETVDGDMIEASKNQKTEVFEIKAFEPVENYLNKYQMDKYYQVRPSPGLAKKDFAKAQAIESNTTEMLKLYTHLNHNEIVARGVLNITSAGFLPSVGYLRAVDLGNNTWTLEIAIFKETKPFSWSEKIEFKAKPRVTINNKSTAQVDEL